MHKIEIYTRDLCGYCAYAKDVLQNKGLEFYEYNIWSEPSKREEMLMRANGRSTVPQIFINGQHLGGCDDLVSAVGSGKLQQLLKV